MPHRVSSDISMFVMSSVNINSDMHTLPEYQAFQLNCV